MRLGKPDRAWFWLAQHGATGEAGSSGIVLRFINLTLGKNQSPRVKKLARPTRKNGESGQKGFFFTRTPCGSMEVFLLHFTHFHCLAQGWIEKAEATGRGDYGSLRNRNALKKQGTRSKAVVRSK
jgi:hypothetical protein